MNSKSISAKGKLLLPIETQCAFWKKLHPELHGTVDTSFLEQVQSISLGEKGIFFHVFALPKLRLIFGKNQPGIFMDLRLIELLRKVTCANSGYTLFNDCLASGRILLKEKNGYEKFYKMEESQKGDFFVFRMQLGHLRPYNEIKVAPPLLENETFPPIGILAAVLCSQKLENIFLDPSWWIASPGSGSETGYNAGGDKDAIDSIPCIEYIHGFCEAENSINILPVKVLLDSEGAHREKEGGIATVISL